MATVSPSPDQATDLLKKVSLDSQPKPSQVPEANNKLSSTQHNAGEAGSGPTPSVKRSSTPVPSDFMNPNTCYYPNGYVSPAYYFGGYDGQMNEWEEHPRYDGFEGVYGDGRNMIYHPGYGYHPYGAYAPGGSFPPVGPDGLHYGPQHYQYAAPYYQQRNSSAGQCNSNNKLSLSHGEVSTSVAPDQGSLPVDTASDCSKGVTNSTTKVNGAALSEGVANSVLPNYPDAQFNFDGKRSSGCLDMPVLDGQRRPATGVPLHSSGPQSLTSRNQTVRPHPHVMGLHSSRPNTIMAPPSSFMDRMYQGSRLYNHNPCSFKTPQVYGWNGYVSRANGSSWLPVDGKYKPRGRSNGVLYYGDENMDVLNEQNKGPRASLLKNQRAFSSSATLAMKGQNITVNENSDDSSQGGDRQQPYNRPEFATKYSHAKFFVIKSYSEDDVHKSIKYAVWASTPNGNRKLDAAYQEALGKDHECPVFLLFSVNTSGQFCGLAEMVGPVDFNKTVDYWQQDKWIGCFPVKWHIIKDIPNTLLKHIILENNDSKPVTNSRDTQEVKFEQGLEILKIFKDHVSKTCLLDDFGFYENRQKQMQESRAKFRQLKQSQKPIWNGKVGDAISEESKPKPFNPNEPVTILQKESAQGLGDQKSSEENGPSSGAGEVSKGIKATRDKEAPDGIANGCYT